METPLALIIEDDKDCAQLFSHILEFVGYQIEIIPDGKEALARLDHIVPKIVLLDLNLPRDISGIDILQHIRSQERLADIPVLVITAYPHIVEGLHEQADLVLNKPVNANQLSALVSRFYPHEISRKMMQNVTIDSSTGLPNKALFLDRIEQAIDRSRRHQDYKFAVLVISLEQVKEFILNGGRKTKEVIIQEIANRLRPILRCTDTFARIGLNKYAVLLEDIRRYGDEYAVAKKIKDELIAPVYHNEEKLTIPVNFSSASSQNKYKRPEEMLNKLTPVEIQTYSH